MIADIARRILGLSGWVALVVVFAGPMLESAAFVGFIFPGEIAVLLGGVLASQHRISLAGHRGQRRRGRRRRHRLRGRPALRSGSTGWRPGPAG